MTRSRLGVAWANVPIPEPHVTGLLAAMVLQYVAPRPPVRKAPRAMSAALVVAGGALAAWSVSAAGRVDLAEPSGLVTTGPFRRTRNPMYVAWTVAYVGIAAWSRSGWAWLLLPVVVAWVHAVVVREENILEGRFGDAWRSYRANTPRYAGAPWTFLARRVKPRPSRRSTRPYTSTSDGTP